MTDGKWTCSTHEENWDCSEEFNTKEEALAYALSEHAPQQGIDDGASIWVGRISATTMEEVAEGTISGDDILDRMACWLYDNVGEDFTDSLDATKEQQDDLERRLVAATIA